MQVARPDQRLAIEQIDLLPARLTQQSIIQRGVRIGCEHLAHKMPTLTQAGKRTLAGGGEGTPGTQRLTDTCAVETIGDYTGQAAARTEHRRGRNTAAATALVLIAVRGGTHPITTLKGFGVDPVELPPSRADFDQSLQLRMMPVEVAPTPADMRHHQVTFRVFRIRGVQLVHRPGARLDGAGGELVPFERAHQPPLVVERELGFSIMQEHHIAVAASAGVAAPFGAGVTHEAARFVEFMNQLDRLVPALLGDVEVVGGVAEDIKAGDITAVTEVVECVIGAHGIIGVHMQVSVQRTQNRARRVDGNESLGAAYSWRL